MTEEKKTKTRSGKERTSHTLSRQGASPQYQLFGSCHLILFVNSTNSIQTVRWQCCLDDCLEKENVEKDGLGLD